MSQPLRTAGRTLFFSSFVGLLVWGVIAGWQLHQARRAGAALSDRLAADWPENGAARAGVRPALVAAAEGLRDGQFATVAADLGPARPATSKEEAAKQRMTAQRSLAKDPDLRARFIATSKTAEMFNEGGTDVTAVREALARAMIAAAEKESARVVRHLESAEAALEEIATGGLGTAGSGPEAVAELVRRIGPAFQLGRDLMTEGHAAAEKLVSQAARHAKAKQHREAIVLLHLAAELLAVDLPPLASSTTAAWFRELAADTPDAFEPVEPSQAAAAVELCKTMAGTNAAGTTATLRNKARLALDAGRNGEAYWWATVALNTLGMTDTSIAAETVPAADDDLEEPDP